MSQRHAAESPPVSPGPRCGLFTRESGQSGAVPRMQRFRLGLFALFGFGVAALVSAIALSTSGRMAGGGGDWSVWSPSQSGLAGAQEIADFVEIGKRRVGKECRYR